MWEYVDDGFHIQFSLFIMLVVIVSRLVTVLALCSICNCFFKEFHMPLSEQLGFTLGENYYLSIHLTILFYLSLHVDIVYLYVSLSMKSFAIDID